MLEEVDIDGNGEISFEEFRDMIYRIFNIPLEDKVSDPRTTIKDRRQIGEKAELNHAKKKKKIIKTIVKKKKSIKPHANKKALNESS